MKEMVKETIIPMIIMLIFGVCFGMIIKERQLEKRIKYLEERSNIQIKTDCKEIKK